MFPPINKQLRRFSSQRFSLSFSPRFFTVVARSIWDRHTNRYMSLWLGRDAADWNTFSRGAGRVVARYQRLRWLMEKLKCLQKCSAMLASWSCFEKKEKRKKRKSKAAISAEVSFAITGDWEACNWFRATVCQLSLWIPSGNALKIQNA